MMLAKEKAPTQNNWRKPVRVYFDGCFDCLHFGHANALRQAKEMGNVLVVGVHSDDDIKKHKGRPPVCPESERYRMVRGIKWVDEVIEGATYLPDVEMLEKYCCDFCVHGDDKSVNADGGDSYRFLKAAGRYRECKRTPGISTTDIIKRLVTLTSETSRDDTASTNSQLHGNYSSSSSSNQDPHSSFSTSSVFGFFPTSKFMATFCSGTEPKATDRVVYVAGDFDLFHIGHLELLEKARAEGDFLLVGIHSDDVVRSYRGTPFPVMTLLERTLNILACRHVSEVVIGAPLTVSAELMDLFRVDVVCHGRTSSLTQSSCQTEVYGEPMNRGKFKLLDVTSDVTTATFMCRIQSNRSEYEERTIESSPKSS